MDMRRVTNLIDKDIKLENIFKKVKIVKAGSFIEMERSEYKEYHGDIGRRIGSGSLKVEVYKGVKEDRKTVKDDPKPNSKDIEAEKLEAEKLEAEKLEAEKLEAEKLEAEKLEAEKAEAEKAAAEDKAAPKLKKKADKSATKKVEI